MGALLAEAARLGVKVILYMPGGMGHWDTRGGPWVGENLRTPEGYAAGLTALVRELVDRYGTQIGGFWLDGLDEKLNELPVLMHQLLPETVVLVNNRTRFNSPDVDAGTTEFLSHMRSRCRTGPAACSNRSTGSAACCRPCVISTRTSPPATTGGMARRPMSGSSSFPLRTARWPPWKPSWRGRPSP